VSERAKEAKRPPNLRSSLSQSANRYETAAGVVLERSGVGIVPLSSQIASRAVRSVLGRGSSPRVTGSGVRPLRARSSLAQGSAR